MSTATSTQIVIPRHSSAASVKMTMSGFSSDSESAGMLSLSDDELSNTEEDASTIPLGSQDIEDVDVTASSASAVPAAASNRFFSSQEEALK